MISTLINTEVQNEGFGRHYWNVPLSISQSDAWLKVRRFSANNDMPNIPLQLTYLSECFTNIAFTFVKLTFFILYWSIFNPFRWLKYGIVSGAVVVVGTYIACSLVLIIEGAPPPGETWHDTLGESRLFIGGRLTVPLAA